MQRIFNKNKNKFLKVFIFLFFFTINLFTLESLKPNEKVDKKIINSGKGFRQINRDSNSLESYSISWQKINSQYKEEEIPWQKISEEEESNTKEIENDLKVSKFKPIKINIISRSLVFDNERIGPDISWVIPPGFRWNKNYKFDANVRGHNTKMDWEERKKIDKLGNRKLFGWNKGDAVALISYQFLHFDRSSFGVNLGIRSLDQRGGGSKIGEGLSGGFRFDYELSDTSGIAFGAEQFFHFDKLTDTGRNIYLTASKGWWSEKYNGVGVFPLYVATGGFGTGRLAVGNVKGLCSDAFGGDGVHINNFGRLCWSPIFSLATVWNEQFSTFFEYNSRLFIIGNSYAPFQEVPLRTSLGIILSDFNDDYKLDGFSEINWIFNLSLGF